MDATELGLLPSMHCAEGHTNILGDLRRLSRGGGDGRDRASGHTLCKHTLLVSTCIVAAALVKLVWYVLAPVHGVYRLHGVQRAQRVMQGQCARSGCCAVSETSCARVRGIALQDSEFTTN